MGAAVRMVGVVEKAEEAKVGVGWAAGMEGGQVAGMVVVREVVATEVVKGGATVEAAMAEVEMAEEVVEAAMAALMGE